MKKVIKNETVQTEDLIDLGAATVETIGPFQKELDGVQRQGRIPAPLADCVDFHLELTAMPIPPPSPSNKLIARISIEMQYEHQV